MVVAAGSTIELLDILLQAGHIDDEQYAALKSEHEQSGKPVDEVLTKSKVVDDELIAKAKGTLYAVPYADIVGKKLEGSVLNSIPKQVAENTKAIAFAREEDTVSVGMIDPRDATARQAIDFLAQNEAFKVKYHVFSPASLNYGLKKYEEIGKEVAKALEVAKEKLVEKPKEEAAAEAKEEKLEEIIKGAPVSRIVSVILRHAVEGGASDIHIEPFGDETRVRYRVDGVLRTSLKLPKYVHNSLVSRVKVL